MPQVVSITQCTELGTLYTPDEIRAICETRPRAGTAGACGRRPGSPTRPRHWTCSMRALTTDVGVDILSLGGTKNGACSAEAVVFFSPDRRQLP